MPSSAAGVGSAANQPGQQLSVTQSVAVQSSSAEHSLSFSAEPSLSFRARAASQPAVVSRRVIGQSVKDHPIRAFELGQRKAGLTVVAVGAMHGNETGGKVILNSLRDGRAIKGVHLWVVPRDNPDGVLRDERHNVHGVDLNRNFGVNWRPLTGYYYAGPAAWSEPETRSLRGFLNRVDPDYVVSFHSPLYGIDVYGAKDRPFARRLSKELALPIKEFDCAGVCHGTLTQWFNKRHAGACVTVELASDPADRYLKVRAPRGLLRAIGGYR
ncbi:MAG: M14 family zinc carboxypeptidase [Nocardioidaceae bacterium]